MSDSSSATQKQKRTRLRHPALLILLALLAVISVAVLLAWQYRSSLMLNTVNRFLSPYDIEVLSLSGVRPGRDTLLVREVVVRVHGNDTPHRLSGVRATYTLHMLAERRIDTLELEKAELSWPFLPVNGSPDKPVPETGLPASADWLPALQSLPLTSLEIRDLSLTPWLRNAALSLQSSARDLHVTLQADDISLAASINWHNTEFVSAYFHEEMLPEEALSTEAISVSLQVSSLESNLLTLDASLVDHEGLYYLELDGSVDTAEMPGLLGPYLQLPDTWPQATGQARWRLSARVTQEKVSVPAYQLTIYDGVSLQMDGLQHLAPMLGAASAVLSSEGELHLQGSYTAEDTMLELSAETLYLTLTALPDLGDLELTITNINTLCNNQFACRSRQHVNAHVSDINMDAVQVSGLTINGEITVESTEGQLQLNASAGMQINAAQVLLEGVSLTNTKLQVAGSLNALSAGDRFSIAGAELVADLPIVITQDGISRARLQIPQLSLEAGAHMNLTMQVVASDMASELIPYNLQSAIYDGSLGLSGEALHLQGDLQLNGQRAVVLDLTHDLQNASGSGSFEVPGLMFDTLWSRLSNFVSPLPVPADLLSGALAGSAQLQWWQDNQGEWQVTGPVFAKLDDVSGLYQETGFVGVSGNIAFTLHENMEISTDALQSLAVGSVDLGIPINDISLDFSVDTSSGQYTLRNLRAEIFGGVVRSSGLVFDTQGDSNSILVELDRIDISQVLSLAAYDAVAASGLLSGEIPLTLTGEALTVTVTQGSLYAHPPGGYIRYRPGGQASAQVSTGNASLDLVYQALSDYQYQILQTQVNYMPDGELILNVRLEGVNPAMSPGGQRINLNLNISDNIPALLRSLQASRSITDALEAQLQNR